ncbi:MAG: RNA methyltransferase [Paludibacteraceae bacterium]|nr:RNA methyltransferase [Paludibacteraceae bacterium]
MPVIRLTSLETPQVQVYHRLTEAQLRHHNEIDGGIFIAESPKVINTALQAGCQPISLLCEEKHIHGDAAPIISRCGDIPVYTGERQLLAQLTGYTLTRGVLCAMRRPAEKRAAEICKDATRVVVIDGVVDSTNIGAIFRSAAALGMDAILLTTTSCDPLNRRSIRVSMGSVFLIPWAWTDESLYDLRALDFKTVAMALTERSVSIEHEELNAEPKLAIIVGTEGDGLSYQAIMRADYVARIPMYHAVDSLNVAAATAVACWQFRKK